MIPAAGRALLRLWWTDATNVAGGWHDEDDLASFASNGAWETSNTGWLVHEDTLCYVLAGRMTDDGQHVGLIERIPKAAVTRTEILGAPLDSTAAAFARGHGSFALSFDAGQNSASPDYRPWTLELGDRSWGGLTAAEALESAVSDVSDLASGPAGSFPRPADLVP